MKKMIVECEFGKAKNSTKERSFSAYGNVKNIKDSYGDVTVDGCFSGCIERMAEKGKYSKLLWGHDSWMPPVGVIEHMSEDTKGLYFEGFVSKTARGDEIYTLGMDGAIDSFSIGYNVIDEEYDGKLSVNLLKEIDVKEISFVNFAANEESLLVEMKQAINNGDLPTRREIEQFMIKFGNFSRSQAKIIASRFTEKKNTFDISELKNYDIFRK